MPFGLIAGNGHFPILALEAARKSGFDVTVIAIKEEADKDIEEAARALDTGIGVLMFVLAGVLLLQ